MIILFGLGLILIFAHVVIYDNSVDSQYIEILKSWNISVYDIKNQGFFIDTKQSFWREWAYFKCVTDKTWLFLKWPGFLIILFMFL